MGGMGTVAGGGDSLAHPETAHAAISARQGAEARGGDGRSKMEMLMSPQG